MPGHGGGDASPARGRTARPDPPPPSLQVFGRKIAYKSRHYCQPERFARLRAQVLERLLAGWSYPRIAADLRVSYNNVKAQASP